MKDFTLNTYSQFLQELLKNKFSFHPFASFTADIGHSTSDTRHIFLRHDVDRKPQNALKTARIENELGIKCTYYFRIVPESFNGKIIKQIEKLGHEIGYHYEEMDTVSSRFGVQRSELELIDDAYELFKKNLIELRKTAEIKTICAHGSPLSRFDNKLIWDKYDFKELGLIGEPNIDVNWSEVAYLTDTGRRWNGSKVSVRDKSPASILPTEFRYFSSTFQIIENIDKLPSKVMITIHPERWNDNYFEWLKSLLLQNTKNIIKKWFFVK